MNKINRFIKIYIIVGFVVCFALMIAYKLNISLPPGVQIYSNIFNPLLGFGLMIWFAILTAFLFTIITKTSIRERSLKKLANIKDQDERERYITGKASKAAYLSSLSLMLFFLFFSVCSVSVNQFKNPTKNGGHKHSLLLTFGYQIMNKAEIKNNETETLFDSRELLPSTATIMLMLIAIQLLAYNFSIRRERLDMIDA